MVMVMVMVMAMVVSTAKEWTIIKIKLNNTICYNSQPITIINNYSDESNNQTICKLRLELNHRSYSNHITIGTYQTNKSKELWIFKWKRLICHKKHQGFYVQWAFYVKTIITNKVLPGDRHQDGCNNKSLHSSSGLSDSLKESDVAVQTSTLNTAGFPTHRQSLGSVISKGATAPHPSKR